MGTIAIAMYWQMPCVRCECARAPWAAVGGTKQAQERRVTGSGARASAWAHFRTRGLKWHVPSIAASAHRIRCSASKLHHDLDDDGQEREHGAPADLRLLRFLLLLFLLFRFLAIVRRHRPRSSRRAAGCSASSHVFRAPLGASPTLGTRRWARARYPEPVWRSAPLGSHRLRRAGEPSRTFRILAPRACRSSRAGAVAHTSERGVVGCAATMAAAWCREQTWPRGLRLARASHRRPNSKMRWWTGITGATPSGKKRAVTPCMRVEYACVGGLKTANQLRLISTPPYT